MKYQKNLKFREPIKIVWLEMELVPGKDDETPTINLELASELCETWDQIVAIDMDPDFKTPIMGDMSDPLAFLLGTRKKWAPGAGTALHQVMAKILIGCKHLEETGE